jgi:hypothetical protein
MVRHGTAIETPVRTEAPVVNCIGASVVHCIHLLVQRDAPLSD